MHKKSMEAAHQLENDDGEDTGSIKGEVQNPSPGPEDAPRDREDLRSESIAQLRAKAQTYSARIMEGVSMPAPAQDDVDVVTSDPRDLSSSFEKPSSQSADSCDNEYLDPGK